ncbi:MAG: ADP-ribosylation factor-like protein, partial [Promethearchaeota archaeon]
SDKEADFLNKFSDKEADYFKKFYYKGVSAIFFVFDLSQPETFESYQKLIKKAWNEGLLKKCPVLIIGNKLDLVINPKTIDRQKYREFVKKEGLLGYIELNSKGNIHPLIKEIPQIIQTNLKKNYQVKFLVNSKEFEEIRRSAKISHQTRSEFIRAAIRDKIRVLNSQEQDLDRPQEIHEDKLRLEELKYIREVLERMEKKENKLKEMR